MVVLTSQRIVLRAGAPIHGAFAGLTWRGAAEIIAGLWREHRAEHHYATYAGLYYDYSAQLAANLPADVPEPRRSRVLELRDLLGAHPWVQSVEDDA